MSETENTAKAPAPSLFKKPKNRTSSARQTGAIRTSSPGAGPSSHGGGASATDGTDGSDEPSAVVKVHHKSGANPLIQGTARLAAKKREREAYGYTGESTPASSSSALGGWSAQDTMGGTKRGLDEDKSNGFATRGADWDEGENAGGLYGEDARALKRPKLDEDGNIIASDGLYHGSASYSSHLLTKPSAVSNKMRAGPIKASNNIRSVTVTDYQPDVCKDYKETGFCGYGDSCKFLHDRGDYLAGWQLDKLAVNPSTGAADVGDEDSDDDDEVPFACLICRQPFTEPVVTKCGHYFCMNCAIKRFAKTPKCYACGAATGGMFNKAERILAKMNKKKADRQEKRGKDMFGDKKEEEEEEGIEFGGEEGGEEEDGTDEAAE